MIIRRQLYNTNISSFQSSSQLNVRQLGTGNSELCNLFFYRQLRFSAVVLQSKNKRD